MQSPPSRWPRSPVIDLCKQRRRGGWRQGSKVFIIEHVGRWAPKEAADRSNRVVLGRRRAQPSASGCEEAKAVLADQAPRSCDNLTTVTTTLCCRDQKKAARQGTRFVSSAPPLTPRHRMTERTLHGQISRATVSLPSHATALAFTLGRICGPLITRVNGPSCRQPELSRDLLRRCTVQRHAQPLPLVRLPVARRVGRHVLMSY